MTTDRLIDYVWVRVGNGEPEPAALKGEKPHRKIITLGCPDPFEIDQPGSGCSIVQIATSYTSIWDTHGQAQSAVIDFEEDYMNDCLMEVSQETADEREKAYQKAIKRKPHNYAGFGRRN